MLNIKAIPSVRGERYGKSFIHPLVPQGSALFIAPSNSGKTTLMVNLILRRAFGIIVTYEEIHIISPTVFMDDNWEMVRPNNYKQFKIKMKDGRKKKTAKIVVHDTYDVNVIQNLLDAQDALEEKKRKRKLIILDDIADSIVQSPVLDRLFFRGRHAGVFCWISSQLYRRVPRSIRVNAPFYVFFRVNSNELATISDELAVEKRNDFIELFMKATGEQYGFFTINAKRANTGRYTANFNEME